MNDKTARKRQARIRGERAGEREGATPPRILRGASNPSRILSADFWRLWFVGFALCVGRWLDMLAMSVYIYQQTASAFLVSLVVVMRFLPMSLLGAFAGALAERVERRTLLLGVNLGLLASASALALLAHFGLLAVWHLFAASFVAGVAIAFDNPVRRLMMAEVVGAERVGTSVAIDVGTNNGTRALGPLVAGALLVAVGIGGVLLLDAAMYLASTVAATRVRHRSRPHAGARGAPVLARIREGWALCRANEALFGVFLLTFVFNLFAYPYAAMVAVIGAGVLNLDAAGTGLLASMDGFGSLAAALAIGLFVRPPYYKRLYAGSVLAAHVLVILFAYAGSAPLAAVALVAVGLTVSGFAVMQNTLIFLLAPPHARAQVMGLLSVAIGINPLGFLIVGALADRLGPSHATALISLAGLAVMFFTRRRWLGLLK